MFCSWAINRHPCLCTWKYPKRQSIVRRSDSSLSRLFASHFHSGLGKKFPSRALPSLLLLAPITRLYLLFFFPRRTTMWIIMNTGGALNDRSIHTMNACGCLFFYYYLAVRNNRANYHVFRFLLATRYRVLSRYEKSKPAYRSRRSGERNRLRSFSGQIPGWEYLTRSFALDSRRFVHVAREKNHFLLPFQEFTGLMR